MKGTHMYAIVKTGGKQYTVKPGDVLDVEKIEGEAGDKVSLDVLFLNDGSNVVTDAGALAKTKVTAEIIDRTRVTSRSSSSSRAQGLQSARAAIASSLPAFASST